MDPLRFFYHLRQYVPVLAEIRVIMHRRAYVLSSPEKDTERQMLTGLIVFLI